MSEAGELRIEPFFNDDLKNIHPAIGIVNGIAYIGVWVPCKVTDDKGHVTAKDYLHLVTSERQSILGLDKELIKRQWKLNYKPIHYREKRWNLADVQAYKDGANVDPKAVFQEVLNIYKEYAEMPSEGLYVLHALWSIGTYFHDIFNSYAYLYVGGVKRSGKTKTLTIHSVLDFNAIFSNNMSSATLYRLIQNSHATLLIDESEKLSNPQRAQEFRNILLAGYKKGPDTYRCGKDARERIEPEGFAVYGPKALANISGLEDVLDDRCIPQFQLRTRNKAIANKEIDLLDSRYAKIRGQLCILFLQYWKEISAIYTKLSDASELGELSEPSEAAKAPTPLEGSKYVVGRELELWKPLYALAAFFDNHPDNAPSQNSQGSLSSLMKALSCKLAEQRHTENVTNVGEENLIQCLLETVPAQQIACWVKVKTVKELMEGRFEGHQEWLTATWVGRALRRLGFAKSRRCGTGVEFDISSAALEDMRVRMQIEAVKEPEEEKKAKEESASQTKLGASAKDGAEATPPKPEENRVAGHCKKWHTGACSFPGNPYCITPLNPCAKTCPDYETGEMSGTEQKEPDSTRIISNEDSKPKVEMKPETSQKADSSRNLDNSEGLAHE